VHDAIEDVLVSVASPSWVVGLYLEDVYEGVQCGFMFSDCLEV
jgi:hypothetical protein